MRYGTYRQRGYFIGSGALESAGKQLTAARIKGPGMRWNVTDLNALLVLRGVFLEHSWQTQQFPVEPKRPKNGRRGAGVFALR